MFNILTLDKVRKIEVEPTTYCNAGCPHCARHIPNTSKIDPDLQMNQITPELIYKLKDDFSEQTNIMDIWYAGNFGDSLMHSQMEDIWKFSAENFRYTEIETNGGARKLDFWKNMGEISKINGNANMVFSIDGLEDTNEIYRKKVNWDRLMENVQAYIGAGGTAIWKWLTFRHNEHQLEEAKVLAKKLGFVQFEPMLATRFDKKTYEASPKTVSKKMQVVSSYDELKTSEIQLASNVSEKIEKRLKKINFDTNVPKIDCKYIKQKRMYLNAQGRIWPCCWTAGWDRYPSLVGMDPLMKSHYRNGFNDYYTRSMSEIFEDPAWLEMTDNWKIKSESEQRQPMRLCHSKCTNSKWEALCNLREQSEVIEFKQTNH